MSSRGISISVRSSSLQVLSQYHGPIRHVTSSFVAPNPEPAWVLSRWVEVPDTGRVDDHMDSLALETGRQTHYA